MAVRKVSNKGGNIIGYYPSIKMGCMVSFESTIERDLIYILDFIPNVDSFIEQPFVITYLDGDKERTYTPDFEVLLTTGTRFVFECKPQSLINKPENQIKFKAARTWCSQQSCEYQVITDEILRKGYRLRNIKFLSQFARHCIPVSLQNVIIHIVKSASGSGISTLEIAETVAASTLSTSIKNQAIAAVFQMAYYHELTTDINAAPIDLDSVVNLALPWSEGNEYTAIFGE
jgi:hypothetical protein